MNNYDSTHTFCVILLSRYFHRSPLIEELVIILKSNNYSNECLHTQT